MAIKVMIVDDAMFMRNMISDIFQGKKFGEEDYEVVAEAENGIEAVERYKEHMPDVVTMDIVMPEMTGIEALKEIMQINADANVIMCSALGQDSLVMEALDSGAKDFIVKPFQPEKVLDVVVRILKDTRGAAVGSSGRFSRPYGYVQIQGSVYLGGKGASPGNQRLHS
jgi:two-component system chemotaxis response regulator CheY